MRRAGNSGFKVLGVPFKFVACLWIASRVRSRDFKARGVGFDWGLGCREEVGLAN